MVTLAGHFLEPNWNRGQINIFGISRGGGGGGGASNFHEVDFKNVANVTMKAIIIFRGEGGKIIIRGEGGEAKCSP